MWSSSAARIKPSTRPWRVPRELRHTAPGMSQAMSRRRGKLDGALRELEMSETNIWVFRAQTIFELACMVELRPAETAGHLRGMSSYCEILCKRVQFSVENCELIRMASQLHDIGSIATPDELLLKCGELTAGEHEVFKLHAETGYRLLAGCSSPVVQIGGLIARSHHERWDGSGYPKGLCEREIPLLGRVAAIADAFDALTSDRLYRSAVSVAMAVEVMREERGVSFDPGLIDMFLQARPELEAVRHAHAGAG
jgi:putative two-component system response regulator